MVCYSPARTRERIIRTKLLIFMEYRLTKRLKKVFQQQLLTTRECKGQKESKVFFVLLCHLQRNEYICILFGKENFMQYIDLFLQHYGWQGTALAAIIIVLFLVQIFYHVVIYGRVARFRNARRRKKLDTEPPISVIVPIFSEDYTYIDERLPLLLGQNYAATFEVVLVYVGSDSDFYEELTRKRLLYPNLAITKIEYNPRFPISTKMAINVGIKSARNEHVIITTTSAVPASEQWLAMMGKAFMRGDIVLGYSGLEQTGGVTNYLMRMSRLLLSTYWLAQAAVGHTYRGSRHNLGFTKSLYFGAKGFTHLNMNIGEEDLFIQKIATKNNVSIALIGKGSMIEHPWGGLKWWISELRHYGEAYRFYPHSARNAVEWELGSQILFFLTSLIALIFMPLEFKAGVLVLILIRYIAVVSRMHSIAKRVGEKGVALRYFMFDLFNPWLMLILRMVSLRKDLTAWK